LNERRKVMARVMDLFVQEIARLPDIQETEGDRFGERSFRVGGREFLHIHGNCAIVPVTPDRFATRVASRPA
jgi:hypothetical protein